MWLPSPLLLRHLPPSFRQMFTAPMGLSCLSAPPSSFLSPCKANDSSINNGSHFLCLLFLLSSPLLSSPRPRLRTTGASSTTRCVCPNASCGCHCLTNPLGNSLSVPYPFRREENIDFPIRLFLYPSPLRLKIPSGRSRILALFKMHCRKKRKNWPNFNKGHLDN